jgi:hypothetical protein
VTFIEAKQALARKLDIDYSDIANNGLFAASDLADYIQAGTNKAWDYKPWTFKEGDLKTTSVDDEYYDYPDNFEDESISRLTVAGKEYEKKLFADYQKYFQNNPTATDRFWSEHLRFYFINQNAYTVGDEIVLLGTLRAPALSSDNDLLPFSYASDNKENSGNRAIIQLAYAEALSSDKKKNPSQGALEEKRGYGMLDVIWAPMAARKAAEQSQDRPFFDVPDYFANGGRGNSKNIIGNF